MPYYKELSPIVRNIIGEKFLRNPRLCRLLACYPDVVDYNYDPYTDKDFDDSNTNWLYMKHIYPMHKIPDAVTEKKGYITVVLSGGYEPEVNTGYRNVNVLIDIIFHLDVWNIKSGYRPYEVMHEIDMMLNNQQTDLPIVNKPYLRGFQPRDYSNYFYGFQLIYELSVNSNITCDPSPQNLNINSDEPDVSIPNSTSNTTKYNFLPKNLGLKKK